MSAIEAIKKYDCYNEQEFNDKEIILKCLDLYDDLFSRDNKMIHMTSSAFVINHNKDKVLMVHHNIFNSWSWTGGHADGEEDLLLVAVKEAKEETGINNICNVNDKIISLDLIPVKGHFKNGQYVSPHLHISVAFIMEGDEIELLIVKKDENSNVKWIPINEIGLYSNEDHMMSIYNKIISKITNCL